MAEADERARTRKGLQAALAAAEQLRQSLATEEKEAERWEARAALAQGKEALDLVAGARERAADHRRRAEAYRAELGRQETHVAELRTAYQAPSPPTPRVQIVVSDDDPVGAQLEKLDQQERLEHDLAELKRQLGRSEGETSQTGSQPPKATTES